MLPVTPSTPLGSEAIRLAERVITRTSAPRFTNSWTVWLPTVPVPPITTIFDMSNLLGFRELPEYQHRIGRRQATPNQNIGAQVVTPGTHSFASRTAVSGGSREESKGGADHRFFVVCRAPT